MKKGTRLKSPMPRELFLLCTSPQAKILLSRFMGPYDAESRSEKEIRQTPRLRGERCQAPVGQR